MRDVSLENYPTRCLALAGSEEEVGDGHTRTLKPPREEFVGGWGWAWASGPVQHEPSHLWSIQPA